MEFKERLRKALTEVMSFSVNDIATNDKLFSFQEVGKEISRITTSAKHALDYPDFIDELPDRDAEQLAGELEGVRDVLNEVLSHRYDSVWLSSAYNSTLDNIRNRYRELYRLLVTPVREYTSSIEANEKRLQELVTEISRLRQETEAAAEHTKEVSSKASTVGLSEYFDSLVGKDLQYSWADRKKDYTKWKRKYEK